MKKFTNYAFSLMVLLLLPTMLLAQRIITGKVTDAETGEHLIGANVAVVGTTTGTSTDVNGSYSINLPDGATTLVFTYTGYSNVEKEVGTETVLNVQLASGELLDEIVVIGYGTIKKEDATGSLQSVSTKDFNKGAITSPQDLLSGKVAGVVISPSADPGGGTSIRIRGESSLSASNSPLIVVDGVPLPDGGISGARNPLNLINPNDIESFTVLKDASAAAIYGSRASGGVILITTKKGKSGGKLKVNYNGNVSTGVVSQLPQTLSAAAYTDLVNAQFPEGHAARDLLGTANTDWLSEIFQTAVGTDHNVSLSGGVKNLPYRLSLGYTNKNGVLKRDNFQRSTVALNLNPGFLDNTLQVNISGKAMFTNNFFANRGAIGSAAYFDPTQPVLDANSPYEGYFTWTQANGAPIPIAPTNPVALLNLRDDASNVQRYVINGSVDYRMPFLKELRANLNLAYDYSYGEGTATAPPTASFAFVNEGEATTYDNEITNKLLEFYLNYTKNTKFGNIDATAGYSWQHFFYDNYSLTTNTDGSKILSPENTSPREYYLISLFGRLNYSLKDKLFLTFTLRRDGSSRFSPSTRWGLFPAAAAAYKVIDEKEGALNKLKLRAGYGITGQQDIGGNYYPYLPVYLESQVNARYRFGNEFYTTLRPGGYDANIKWEETTTYNIGLDFGIMDNLLTGTFDVYQKQTNDLLNFIPVPAGTNLTNFITTNVGDMKSSGVELTLNAQPIKTADMSWDIGGNIALQQNEITRLIATNDPDYLGVFTGGIAGGVGNTVQIHSVGYSPSSFFVYEQVYDENNTPIEGLYVDRNGDGQVTPDDRYHLNNPAPNTILGLTTSFRYKDFEFSMAGRAHFGNYIYNNVWSDQATYNRLYNSAGYLANVHPEVTNIDFNTPQLLSDHFIQNASFFRLDHVTASYSFSNLFDKIQYLKVFATAQNALIITQYKGMDPESGGIDNNIYPRALTILFGVSANF